ncbi:hypothetical protein DL762_007620 [Monosporascus cannonballus]|uniref:Uncharacterized protein n=1 Tax=Monosporascus cannonballus TaxID=155416 RepID=A0ABY0H308_9PEZI|nr:hypothetical protein DL762_007620 [Monosporascus cannonballus]
MQHNHETAQQRHEYARENQHRERTGNGSYQVYDSGRTLPKGRQARRPHYVADPGDRKIGDPLEDEYATYNGRYSDRAEQHHQFKAGGMILRQFYGLHMNNSIGKPSESNRDLQLPRRTRTAATIWSDNTQGNLPPDDRSDSEYDQYDPDGPRELARIRDEIREDRTRNAEVKRGYMQA